MTYRVRPVLGDVFVCALALTLAVGVGSLVQSCIHEPAQQVAVVAAQSVETALDALQDFERSLCFNTPSTRTAPTVGESGPTCTNATAATIGLTSARHVAIEAAIGRAFTLQGKVAVALAAWTPGSAAPTDLAGLSAQVSSAITVAQVLVPNGPGATVLKDTLAVLTAVNQIATAIGVPTTPVPTPAATGAAS